MSGLNAGGCVRGVFRVLYSVFSDWCECRRPDFLPCQQLRYLRRVLFLPAAFCLDGPFFVRFILRDFVRGTAVGLARRVGFFDFRDDVLAGLADTRRAFFFAAGLRGA